MSRPRPLRWLEAARDDLGQIAESIAADNPRAAERLSERILDRVQILSDHPHLGSPCPFAPRVRFLVVGNYTVHRKEVVIRAVVHGRRLFRPGWLRRE